MYTKSLLLYWKNVLSLFINAILFDLKFEGLHEDILIFYLIIHDNL